MAGHRRIRSPQGTGGNGSVEVATRLAELVDVTITAAADGDYLRHNGTAWVDVDAGQLVSDINALLDHGTLAGLTDDDHAQYLLASDATDRATFAAYWTDLTDGGETTLHTHPASATDHGGLTGLSDDDHAQYALLAGRSGGQTLIGSTAASEHLVLKSTSNATEGEVQVKNSDAFRVYDPNDTQSTAISHNATDGIIATSTGHLRIQPASDIYLHPGGGDVLVLDTGGTLSLALTHNGTDGVISTSSGDIKLSPITGFVGINQSNPAFPLDVATTVTNTVRFYTTNDNSNGVSVHIVQDSASPADNDKVGTFYFLADDDTGVQRVIGRIAMQFDDVTKTTMDSSMIFSTQDAVNAGDYNKNARLTSLGVWTDASSEEGKRFEGVIPGVLEKLRLLDVQKYRSANVSGAKVASAERHCSPSAENFWDVFGLGVDPRRVHQDKDGRQFKKAGIAPKDLAGVALLGLKEAAAKIVALEQRVAALEAA